MPRFYRVVVTDPPTEADFLSDRARGKPPPRTPELLRLWDGLSVMDTEEGAREIARNFPANGAFIAALAIPNNSPIRYERTLRRPGHYTIWGEAAALLDRVEWVTPVL